jgi:hypothetical protein
LETGFSDHFKVQGLKPGAFKLPVNWTGLNVYSPRLDGFVLRPREQKVAVQRHARHSLLGVAVQVEEFESSKI